MPSDKKDDNSYMDGVPVKISEKYKRPPIIRLPVSCQNCNPGQALFEEYDFRLERSVITKMEEWKKAREEQAIRREERLKKLNEIDKETEKMKEMYFEQSAESEKEVKTGETVQETSILTPVNAATTHDKSRTIPSSFNFSDFESDNSSPFDNMELKTINDMEVLASVLSSDSQTSVACKPTSPPPTNNNFISNKNGIVWNGYNLYSSPLYYGPSSHYPNINMYAPSSYKAEQPHSHTSWLSGDTAMYHSTLAHTSTTNPYQYPPVAAPTAEDYRLQSLKSNSKSVPDLVAELENELKEKRQWEEQSRKTKTPPPRPTLFPGTGLENWKPWPELESPRHCGPDSLETLSSSHQLLARGISEMGFPLPRIVRTIRKFNGDDKKVIEFLLQVQRLEEKKFKGDLVERALHANNYNEKETLKHLDATVVLLDLGFDAEKVEKILLECQNDRDAALERLIS